MSHLHKVQIFCMELAETFCTIEPAIYQSIRICSHIFFVQMRNKIHQPLSHEHISFVFPVIANTGINFDCASIVLHCGLATNTLLTYAQATGTANISFPLQLLALLHLSYGMIVIHPVQLLLRIGHGVGGLLATRFQTGFGSKAISNVDPVNGSLIDVGNAHHAAKTPPVER